MNTNFGPQRRPLTAREKSIRFKYSLLFVFATLCALTMGVLYNRQNTEMQELKEMKSQLDSSFTKLDYIEYNVDDEGDTIMVSVKERIDQMTNDASRYRDLHDDLFELTSNNARYEMALEYYADPLMHQEYRDRTGTNFRSKYSESQRKEIVEKIRKEIPSFNQIIPYMLALDWYREIDPVAVEEIEVFTFFTE